MNIKGKKQKKINKSVFFKRNFHSIYKDKITLLTLCDNVVKHFALVKEHRGLHQSIIFHKELLRFIQQRCMDQEVDFCHERSSWTKMRSGYPRFLFKGIEGNPNHFMKCSHFRQGMLTACNYYKLYSIPPKISYETIICPNRIEPQIAVYPYSDIIADTVEDFIVRNNISQLIMNKTEKFTFATPASSANGKRALGEASVLDAIAVWDSGLYPFLESIANSVFTEKAFESWKSVFLESLAMREQILFPGMKTPVSGRLTFFAEGGGKTRVVAIPDIWTQTVLKPVHNYLMNILSRLTRDGTYSHNQNALQVGKATRTKALDCFDLTAATDRMPIYLQRKVLKHFLGEKLSSDWRDVMVERLFYHNNNAIRYAVGQPMGLLSSWAAMTLTHHIIIQSCLERKTFYSVIGDDMAIEAGKASREYRYKLLMLDMDISYEKSVLSTKISNVGEIAKRLFVDGFEISPIPPKILANATGSLIGFLEFMRVLYDKTHLNQDGIFFDANYRTILERLLQSSTVLQSKDNQIILSSPLLSCLGPYKELGIMVAPLSGVTPMWEARISAKIVSNRFDQFLTEEATNRINTKVIEWGLVDLTRKLKFNASKGEKELPLYRETRKAQNAELIDHIRRINVNVEDGDADLYEKSATENLIDVLSLPDPLQADKIYLEKGRIRLREAKALILKFYNKNPMFHPRPKKGVGNSRKPNIKPKR